MTASTFETPQLPSIRQRLVRALAAASVLWVLVVSATAWLTIRHQVNELADAGLQESGELLYGLMATLEQPLQATRPAAPLPAPAHQEKVIWQRVGPDGQVVLRSHHAPATAFFSQPPWAWPRRVGCGGCTGCPCHTNKGCCTWPTG